MFSVQRCLKLPIAQSVSWKNSKLTASPLTKKPSGVLRHWHQKTPLFSDFISTNTVTPIRDFWVFPSFWAVLSKTQIANNFFLFPLFFSHKTHRILSHKIDNTIQKTKTGDERFVQRLRQASSSDSDSDSTSDSDEKEPACVKTSNVAARAAAVAAATGQQQSRPLQQQQQQQQKDKQSLERNREAEKKAASRDGKAEQQQQRGVKKTRRHRPRPPRPAPTEEKSVPLKTEAAVKPELVEPLKRAMSSDLIPIDESSKQNKPADNDNKAPSGAQSQANSRSFSVMDDGWGI